MLGMLEVMPLDGITSHYIKYELTKSTRPIFCLKQILSLRADFISDVVFHGENTLYTGYDQYFNGNLEFHLKEALVLPVETRTRLLERLGFSIKNILPNIKFEESWKSILQYAYTSEMFKLFYETLTVLERSKTIDTNKLTYILDYYDLLMTVEEFEAFKKSKYELTVEDIGDGAEKNDFKYLVFHQRLKNIL